MWTHNGCAIRDHVTIKDDADESLSEIVKHLLRRAEGGLFQNFDQITRHLRIQMSTVGHDSQSAAMMSLHSDIQMQGIESLLCVRHFHRQDMQACMLTD